jgi:hypothetical protein
MAPAHPERHTTRSASGRRSPGRRARAADRAAAHARRTASHARGTACRLAQGPGAGAVVSRAAGLVLIADGLIHSAAVAAVSAGLSCAALRRRRAPCGSRLSAADTSRRPVRSVVQADDAAVALPAATRLILGNVVVAARLSKGDAAPRRAGRRSCARARGAGRHPTRRGARSSRRGGGSDRARGSDRDPRSGRCPASGGARSLTQAHSAIHRDALRSGWALGLRRLIWVALELRPLGHGRVAATRQRDQRHPRELSHHVSTAPPAPATTSPTPTNSSALKTLAVLP